MNLLEIKSRVNCKEKYKVERYKFFQEKSLKILNTH